MREVAQMLLQLVRYANRNGLNINPVVPELTLRLQISNDECNEIAEVLKADIRELKVTYQAYDKVNDILKKMSPEKPYGI